MEFKCTACGACCKRAGLWGGAKHGLPIKEDGSCGHLKGKLCSIYDKRPLICQVRELNEYNKKLYPDFDIKQAYIDHTINVCHKLIDEDGLDESYKIDIKEYD